MMDTNILRDMYWENVSNTEFLGTSAGLFHNEGDRSYSQIRNPNTDTSSEAIHFRNKESNVTLFHGEGRSELRYHGTGIGLEKALQGTTYEGDFNTFLESLQRHHGPQKQHNTVIPVESSDLEELATHLFEVF